MVAHATETPAAPPTSASGGCIGVIGAILVALGRAVFLHPERRENRSDHRDTEPAITPDVEDASEAAVRTVTGVGPVPELALSPDGRYAYVAAASASAPWTVKVVDTESDPVVKTIEDLADVVAFPPAASPGAS